MKISDVVDWIAAISLLLLRLLIKDVNTVPVWPPVRYISDTGQYRCTVSDLPLFFIFINIYIYIYIYICMYVCMYVCMCLCIYIL